MTIKQISELTSSQRLDRIKGAAVDAVQHSIVHSNVSTANDLLSHIYLFTPRPDAKVSLVAYLEKWGNMGSSKQTDDLKFHRKWPASHWTEEYKGLVADDDWTEVNPKARKRGVRDVDAELRKLVENLTKVEGQYLVHRELLAKVKEAIYAYGRSDPFEKEQARGQTLFNKSISMKTMRATIYAK